MSFKGIVEWVERHVVKIISVPLAFSVSNYFLTLFQGGEADMVTDELFHQVIHLSSGLDAVLLIIILSLLKKRRK